MEKVLGKYTGTLVALLRIVAGLMYACHGAQKLFGVFGGVDGQGATVELLSRYGLAGVIEFFGGVLIALGLFSGYAGFIASGQMAVAYFMAHFPGGFWPILNKGELAIVYCFLFLFIAAHGPGPWSLKLGGSK